MLRQQLDLDQSSPITTIQLYPSDYELALKQLLVIYGDRHGDKPVFYWNNGYRDLVKLSLETPHLRYSPTTSTETCDNPLLLIQEKKLPAGLYIFDNLLDFDLLSLEDKSIRESQIYNCANRLVHQPEVSIILLGEWIQLSPKLRLKLNQIQLGLPNSQEIAQTLAAEIKQKPPVKLISACQGLSWGDIYYELAQSTSQTESIIPIPLEALAEKFLSLKENILNNSELKLEYFSKIEIPRLGGNDLLNKFLFEKLIKLNEPNANRYGLKPPKAMLFVGPPGTGKSLTAKMTAKALGYTLMGMSFGDILGSDNPDRIVSLLLELAQSMGKVILFLDDWDKGLGNWESGGAARRIVQKFLTWMQEHTSSVITIATVNRIELLPAELIRRFDDGGIWMLDLPNRGAIYDIFNIYLAKCFPHQFSSSNPESVSDTPWDMEQWNELIDESTECTPVEIADVVQTCLVDWYCALDEKDRVSSASIPTIDFEYLLTKVMQINKASVRASESIQAMRNNAWFAKPASSPDSSPFKLPEEVLLGGG